MRVAYICADGGVPVFGRKGCSIHVQEVVQAFLERGVKVELFAANVEGDSCMRRPPTAIHRLPRPARLPADQRERFSLDSNRALSRLLRDHGPFDLVYERYSLWSHAGMDYARAGGIPAILEVNAPLLEESRRHRVLVDEESALNIARHVFSSANHCIVVSRRLAEYVERLRGSRHGIHTLPNAANTDRFKPVLPRSRPTADRFTVGFVGTLKPWHDTVGLVEAFAETYKKNRNSRLLLVGDGPEKAKVKQSIKRLKIKQAVRLEGSVDPDSVPALLNSVDVGVAPYPNLEDFYFSPIKIFEYMASGLPVVAGRIGQIPEVIEHGVHGLLYRPGDGKALSEALDRLQSDDSLRRRLGNNARKCAELNHSWHARARQILEIGGFMSEASKEVLN